MGQVGRDEIGQYIASLRAPADGVLAAIAAEGRLAGLPVVHEDTGRLLRALAYAIGARRALEIGTATGCSGVWIAGALPSDGMLMTLERDATRAAQARSNFERAGLGTRVSVIVGEASRYLHKVAGPFDLIFQDGDKLLYEPLLERLVELLRPGGVLVSDNVLWNGAVIEGCVEATSHHEPTARAIAAYNRRISAHPRLFTTILPVGDGVAVSVKLPR